MLGSKFLLKNLENKGKVVILMYHKVTTKHDPIGISIDPHFFEMQMKYIKDKYTPISLSKAVDYINGKIIDKNYIVVTFDDGYADNYAVAYPILEKYAVPATVFITSEAVEKGYTDWSIMDEVILNTEKKEIDLTKYGLEKIILKNKKNKFEAILYLRSRLKKVDHSIRKQVIQHLTASTEVIGRRIMLTWEEVSRLASSGLVTIGAHTISHPILSRLSPDEAYFEIAECKRVIQEKTNLNVDLFAYPNGSASDFNDKTMLLVSKAGFKAACTTIPGVNRLGSDLLRLKRIDVTHGICTGPFGNFSQNMFGAFISGEYGFLTSRA